MGGMDSALLSAMGRAVFEEAGAPPRIPWDCECGAHVQAPAFVVPRGWTIMREEEGTGLLPTRKLERVLCERCSDEHREAAHTRKLRRATAP